MDMNTNLVVRLRPHFDPERIQILIYERNEIHS